MTTTVETLRAVPVFAGLDDAGLARVGALATEFTARAGHVLIEHGQPGTGLFVIEDGAVRVELPEGENIGLGPGEFVGELALLADTPRKARVVVTADLRALAIRRDDLADLLESEPALAVAMLRVLAQRLAASI